MSNLADVVFLATPAEVSLRLAPQIRNAGKTVIDLSGAFRLKAHDYKTWYGFDHEAPTELASAHYGLVPFATKAGAGSVIANPGCYASAISLALIPLLRDGIIRQDGIVIDAKSGTTGAGKKAAENLLFSEVAGECLPYKVGKHQHLPEVTEAVRAFAKVNLDAHFVTSLLSVRRGIIAGVYASLVDGKTLGDVQDC
ncbi:MAG: N-acetyl-gamma-glutamyl-phosphate reductase, partial [Proteobacteria bacterium]